MKSFKEFIMEQVNGTFVGVKYSAKTEYDIISFMENNNIPNPIKKEELHTTLIFSRTKIENLSIDEEIYPIVGYGVSPNIWESGDKTTHVLVVKISAPRLVERHKDIMQSHPEATYDFPEYIPHVTLSYDIDPQFDINTLNMLKFPVLEIVKEYSQKLDLEFGK